MKDHAGGVLILVDADMLAGWRRPTPSLAQLHQAVLHLERQHPEATVAVVADPALKWALPAAEQPAFEADIVARVVTCAPAGAIGATHGFLAAAATRARHQGLDVVAVTDRAVPDVPLARVRNESGRWSIDLANTSMADAGRAPAGGRAPRRRRRSSR